MVDLQGVGAVASADANAESAEIVEHNERGRTWYDVRILYSYTLGDIHYTGRVSETFGTQEEANDYWNAMRAGSFIIHYNPKRKDQSRFFA